MMVTHEPSRMFAEIVVYVRYIPFFTNPIYLLWHHQPLGTGTAESSWHHSVMTTPTPRPWWPWHHSVSWHHQPLGTDTAESDFVDLDTIACHETTNPQSQTLLFIDASRTHSMFFFKQEVGAIYSIVHRFPDNQAETSKSGSSLLQ